MQASRRSTDNVPAKKRYKEYSPKKIKKIEEQQILYDLAKDVFKRSVKLVDVQTRRRKKENYFKIKLNGFDVISEITTFHSKMAEKFTHYKFNFSGSINPRTDKQEVFLYVTIFNHEGNYETTKPVVASQRSERERYSGVFGKTEIRSHTTHFTS